MKVYDEMIHTIEDVRMQCMLWAGTVWNIFCNDRFEEDDFEIKVHCEVCGPNKFVPKVLDIYGHRFCNSCLTRFSDMIQAATLADCGRSREERKVLQEKLENKCKYCGYPFNKEHEHTTCGLE